MFLDEAKQTYTDVADLYPGWKDKSRSELCREYVELKDKNDPASEYCLSAIICKFWNLMSHNYYNQQVKIATPEDCHAWVIDSILFVLKQHVWTDPNSTLYNDPDAPEKAINVCVTNEKINFFVAQKRHKRVLNTTSYSLDALLEESSDDYYLPCSDNYHFLERSFDKYILDAFIRRDYVEAFSLYILLKNQKLVEKKIEDNIKYDRINYSKLKQCLMESLNDKFAQEFAKHFKLNPNLVFNAVLKIDSYDTVDENNLKGIINQIKNDVVAQELYLGD